MRVTPLWLPAPAGGFLPWLVTAFGSGIGIGLSLDRTPPALYLSGAALLLLLLAGLLFRHGSNAALAVAAIGMIAGGPGWTGLRTAGLPDPSLPEPLFQASVSGRVLMLDRGRARSRLLLSGVSITGVTGGTANFPDSRIRLVVRGPRAAMPAPGEWIRIERARLFPPSGPAEPGAFDMARHAWLNRILAYGSARADAITVVAAPVPGGIADRMLAAVRRLSLSMSDRIHAVLPPRTAGIAAALITGERGGISREANQEMLDSGLFHILSISGLHIALVAGIVFLPVRFLLVLFARPALLWPVRSIAALAALAAAGFYALLAGFDGPTQRALLMAVVTFGGFLFDRRTSVLRSAALAALLILVITPGALTEPGFQMSFAAVVAIAAVADACRARGVRRPVAFLLVILAAGLGSGILALYHFQRHTSYGLVANLLADFLVAFWIMPAAVLSALAMLPGLEAGPLWMTGEGISLLRLIARTVAGWPGAVIPVPALAPWALPCLALAGLWLCLAPGRLALAAIPFLLLAISGQLHGSRPDLVIAASGRQFSALAGDGSRVFLRTETERHDALIWQRRDGNPSRLLRPLPRNGPLLSCDADGCLYRGRVAIALAGERARENCGQRLALVIMTVPLTFPCDGPERVIDSRELARGGAQAVHFRDDGGIVVIPARAAGNNRPWNRGAATRRDGHHGYPRPGDIPRHPAGVGASG